MKMQRYLSQIEEKGASLVAISPMLPDGTYIFASRRDLGFPVLSDIGNEVAKKFKITFQVPEEIRPTFENWGENIPLENRDPSWQIPLPATYVINQQGDIIWSFIDNDPGVRGEPDDIIAAIPDPITSTSSFDVDEETKCCRERGHFNGSGKYSTASKIRKSIRNSFKGVKLFGKKGQPAGEFIMHYKI